MIMSLMLTACGGDATSDGGKELEKEQYGIIVLNQNGEVLSGAQVALGGASETTGNDGTVTIEKTESPADRYGEFSGCRTGRIVQTG